MIGSKFAHYEITSHLGSGGMGDVYQATDSKLGRSVAIKILPEAFVRDPDRVARFEREGRVLAALNHPHIAAVYGFENSGDTKFLVMELATGETLAARLARGPLPMDEALSIAEQIVDALEDAHEHGVIHRDLKPANIKISPNGQVKVLDFGLAKAFAGEAAVNLSNSPTLSHVATNAGLILGTAAYMSPEQAKGAEVDRRTDLFSFGAVLYEILTGRQAFQGDTAAEIMARVMEREPDWSRLPNDTPVAIRRLIERCLRKDRKRRVQTAAEARIDIEDARTTPGRIEQQGTRGRGVRVWQAVAASMIVVAAGIATLYLNQQPPVPELNRFQILAPENTLLDFSLSNGPLAVSPDGRRLVFTATETDGTRQLWLHPLDALNAQPVAGTDGASFPFWSPDSRFIGFFAGGKLKKVDSAGGPAVTLADASAGRGGSWSSEGVIVFAPSVVSPLEKVSESGGASIPITTLLKDVSHRFPWFLPDGQHFLYQVQEPAGISIWAASPESDPVRVLEEANSNAVYSQGHLLFLRETTLMAQPFDVKRLATTGEAVPVAEQVRTVFTNGMVGVFSVSSQGLLAYQTGALATQRLTWIDRQGKTLSTVGEPGVYTNLSVTLDATRAAVVRDRDVWTVDLLRNTSMRLTFDGTAGQVRWSPDGKRVAYTATHAGIYGIYQKPSDGSGVEELLLGTGAGNPNDWSRDGSFLGWATGASGGLVVLPMNGDRKPVNLLQSVANVTGFKFSPDGRWISYASDETARNEIYVKPFDTQSPNGSASAGKWLVSKDGALGMARWRGDGKELFYLARGGNMMSVDISTNPVFKAGAAKALFQLPSSFTRQSIQLGQLADVTPDGQRFLFAIPDDDSPAGLTIVQNWTVGLKK